MKEGIFGFMVGAGLGISLLLCPKVREYVDKMTNQIEKKVEKMKKKANKIKQDITE